MTKLSVRADPDAGALDPVFFAQLSSNVSHHFGGLRCTTHGLGPEVVATVRRGAQVEFKARVCCRQMSEAVELVLTRHFDRPR